MKWVNLNDARLISGHPSNKALWTWITRWNAKRPDLEILKRPHYVERESLELALKNVSVTAPTVTQETPRLKRNQTPVVTGRNRATITA